MSETLKKVRNWIKSREMWSYDLCQERTLTLGETDGLRTLLALLEAVEHLQDKESVLTEILRLLERDIGPCVR